MAERRYDSSSTHPRQTIQPTDRSVRGANLVQATQEHWTTAETRCEVDGRLLARFQHENGRTHCEQQCSGGGVPQKEERWNREMLLGILGNPWSLQDGRVEVNPDPAAPARYLPMVKTEVQAEPKATRTRNDENGRSIYITKKASESGATLGCRGYMVIGQLHTEECRAKIIAPMENDPVHAKRLEDHLNKRNEFANLVTTVAVPSQGRSGTTKRARQDELETPQESGNTGGASGCSAGADVDMRVIHADKRPLDPGGDMVCGLDVRDELDELDEKRLS